MPSTIKKISYEYPTIRFLTGSRIVVKRLYECGVDLNNIMYFNTKNWINAASQMGCRSFILATRVLTQNELNYYIRNLRNSEDDMIGKEETINQIIDSLESNLT